VKKHRLCSSQVLLWISSFSFSRQSAGSWLCLDRRRTRRPLVVFILVMKVIAAYFSADLEAFRFLPKQVSFSTKKNIVFGGRVFLTDGCANLDVMGLTDNWRDLHRLGRTDPVRQMVISIGLGESRADLATRVARQTPHNANLDDPLSSRRPRHLSNTPQLLSFSLSLSLLLR
jgi:hypothetical protein